MEIILRTDVPNLGRQGDIVTVKPGYARNYLIPKSLAMPVTKGARRQIEFERAALDRKLATQRDLHQALADKIDEKSFTVAAKAGDTGRLYGSVSENEIVTLLDEVCDIQIERNQVRLDDNIKQVGVYHVPIRFQEGIEPQIKLWVVPEGEEAVGLPEDAPRPQLFVGGHQSLDVAKAHAEELLSEEGAAEAFTEAVRAAGEPVEGEAEEMADDEADDAETADADKSGDDETAAEPEVAEPVAEDVAEDDTGDSAEKTD
ncbi:MAG: 50S ribosomal protein L9 [Candidatus Coatesbacteria bacterium]|nr:50S ribosomal protein L9 [Candidatus Coatesbacteria bacterium]